MKRVRWSIQIVLVLGVVGFGCNAPNDTEPAASRAQPTKASVSVPPEQAEREVRQIHEAYYTTLVEEGPVVALERYYGDDYTYIGVDGKMIDKAGLEARMQRNELGIFTLEDDLRRVSIYGDVVVLNGHSTTSATDKGKEHATTEGYTEVWIRRAGRWQLVAEQITPQK